MKKSVLIALLGLTTTEGMKVNQKDDTESQGPPAAHDGASKNGSGNATKSSALVETGFEFVQAIADLDAKQDAFDHEQEMEDADDDADAVVHEADSEGSGEEEGALAGVQADGFAPEAAPLAAAAGAPAAAAPAAKTPKNKDSSDEECACAPGKESVKQKASIKAK